ncbi:MAG: amidohydrolase [Nocardioides sp.]
MDTAPATRCVDDVVGKHADDLVQLRRDLHAHPELSWHETRTTDLVVNSLDAVGYRISRLPRTGLVAEIGDQAPVIALRADLDALPVDDTTGDPWASRVDGVAHACGHDVHTAGLVGAALALAEVYAAGLLPGRVRLLFQPAEEVMPGGAHEMVNFGALDDVERIFCVHCDPTVDVGQVGLREGAVTGAADSLGVTLTGSGGHTSRPHLTEDLTFALAKVVTEVPAVLSRRLDPRAGVSVVFGRINAGTANNVVPQTGTVGGTVRMLDPVAWAEAEGIVRAAIDDLVRPYGVSAAVDYRRGVPPVVNDAGSIAMLGLAVDDALGAGGRTGTSQSLGGEDFGWYRDKVPGALARLGTRSPGGPTYDLHQGNLRIDEQATLIAARLLANVAIRAFVTTG